VTMRDALDAAEARLAVEEIAAREAFVEACRSHEDAGLRASGYEILHVEPPPQMRGMPKSARPVLCWERSAYYGGGGHCFGCHRHPPGAESRCHNCGVRKEDR
jgi:hypothetical protein